MKANVKRSTLVLAFVIAIFADLLEMGLFPIFSEGFASPASDFVDVVVCIILTLLIGWHIAFIPSFLIKVIPVVDMAPTWTLAVLIASRHRQASETSDVPPPPIIGSQKPAVLDVKAVVEKQAGIVQEK